MARIYFYKLTADNGGAPCVQDGLLSLAICKPFVRTTAKEGALIFGFAANSLHADNRLIYIARVTKKVLHGLYYTTPRFARRADCVYERRGNEFRWRTGALYHGPRHLRHDLGPHPHYPRAAVLLSRDFRYFGARGSAEYKVHYALIKVAVERLGRGHRVHHGDLLKAQFLRLKRQTWKEEGRKATGRRTVGSRRACDRSQACGVVGR